MQKTVKIDRIKSLAVFAKAQTSAFVGGVCDYCLMVCFTELAGMHYALSIAVGCILGAAVNFTINRKWSFYSKDRRYQLSNSRQTARFVVVAGSSIVLKIAGTHLFTLLSGIDYKICRLVADLFVSLFYNYVLQRFWVFKTMTEQNSDRFGAINLN